MDQKTFTWQKVANLASTLGIGGGLLYLVYDMRWGSASALELDGMSLYFLYIAMGILFNGLIVRRAHMTKVKRIYLTNKKPFNLHSWRNRDIGPANFLPMVIEQQYASNALPLIQGGRNQRIKVQLDVPKTFNVSIILLRTRLYQIAGILMWASMLILPRVLKDYELYMGLMYEQAVMMAVGMTTLIFTIMTTIINYSLFRTISQVMNRGGGNWRRNVLVFLTGLSVVVVVLTIVGIIFGALGFQIPILRSVFNFDIILLYMPMVPIINIIQAVITSGQLGIYQTVLDRQAEKIY